MLVYIQSNYSNPNLLRQTPQAKGIWEDITFTFDKVKECDYIIVINHPTEDIKIKCKKKGSLLLIQEPPYTRNEYLKVFFPYFDTVISAFNKGLAADMLHVPAALPWLINKNYDELIALNANVAQKKNKLSWVTSNSNVNPGHAPRLKFLEMLKQSDLNVDLFGRGIQPIADKFDALYPYKYTLAIENYSDENYWTEKIADAYLSWTVPIYYGCKNMEDFFPANSFIKIDIEKPEEALLIIAKSIEGDFYEKNLKAIEEARNLVLHTYQFFPFMTNLIKNKLKNEQESRMYSIPVNPFTEGFLHKIKRLIKIK